MAMRMKYRKVVCLLIVLLIAFTELKSFDIPAKAMSFFIHTDNTFGTVVPDTTLLSSISQDYNQVVITTPAKLEYPRLRHGRLHSLHIWHDETMYTFAPTLCNNLYLHFIDTHLWAHRALAIQYITERNNK